MSMKYYDDEAFFSPEAFAVEQLSTCLDFS